ncbi:ABC transporter permease [Oricola thermophila]|uniref:ABC transporter permease n=1 Tax=Oricola thermophila TaxID=2742145 RepID=A0A6N1VIC0_9HYPH|nr:ABC transporter permease [Oricola thermophila]QKV20514.1 ABC transporter permease [Oricola thermophila]
MHTENDEKAGTTSTMPQVQVLPGSAPFRLKLSGAWATHTVAAVDKVMRDRENDIRKGDVVIDMSGVSYLDTAGAWVVYRTASASEDAGHSVRLDGVKPSHQVLLDAVRHARERLAEQPPAEERAPLHIRLLAQIGEAVYAFRADLLLGMHMVGAAVRGSQMKLGHGSGLSIAAVVNQLDRTGVRAIPIVILMSTIIGAIIAQQGAFQLRYFGAEIFVVDLVGILVLREIGVLLTAIMIAGRSGSAITAEIGSMKMREEIDALTVIGLNPVGVLVFPRLVALGIALPLLTVISDLAALAGAMFVAKTYSGISLDAFMTRLRDAVDLTTLFAGFIKAPFMAFIIGIIASVEGMKVGGSAESLGERVTASVVKSIFVVIVVDGLFAMFYAAIDF